MTGRRTQNRHPEIAEAIREILKLHAVLNPMSGSIVLCQPRDIELKFHPLPGNPAWTGNNGKVCFPDESSATAAADEIAEVPGADRVKPYPCHRGGHWHHVEERRHRASWEAAVFRMAQASERYRRNRDDQ
jgi:hypothetical protein